MLITIQEATHYFDTACKPLLAHGSDLQYYVAKYASVGDTAAERLLREYLGTAFLGQWHLATQPYSFIRLRREDVGVAAIFRRSPNINVPMFGSLYNAELKEADQFLAQMPVSQRGSFSGEDFLAICFADIWLGNDDRNWNNQNLMMRAEGAIRRFVPIDHEAIFNGGNLKLGLYTLDAATSLLSTPLLHRLFTTNQLSNEAWLQALFSKWYLCIQSCKKATPVLLAAIPQEWQINVGQLQQQLSAQLFTDEWFAECRQAFLEILQQAINTRSHGN